MIENERRFLRRFEGWRVRGSCAGIPPKQWRTGSSGAIRVGLKEKYKGKDQKCGVPLRGKEMIRNRDGCATPTDATERVPPFPSRWSVTATPFSNPEESGNLHVEFPTNEDGVIWGGKCT